jgi:cellulose synthase/poly-beta-1,6-N-acetylglucosamine synthase-like glycosyltransferase
MRSVTVPRGQPRTKPRALNVGLSRARGELVVVYDAEDRPEPDQLRKAAAAFRVLPRRIVCLQARLNFYNRRQSVLARLFAADYVQWYYMLFPGMVRGAQPLVPLGGTSNHFRVEVLRRLGGWDPYNVTEDCDLGVRITRVGLRVGALDSTTWEEAVPRVLPWVRQRSRWVKGYIQTYLVHMRHPIRLWRDVGQRGFLDFQLLVGGSSLLLLVNPLMWALLLAYLLTHGTSLAAAIGNLFPTPLYYASLLSFVAGNFLFFYTGLYVCVRHGFDDLTRYALLAPFYWVLMSVGAWAGVISLVRRPHYWAKTEHGISLGSTASLANRLAARRALSHHDRGQHRSFHRHSRI